MPNRLQNDDLLRSRGIARGVCVAHARIGVKSFGGAAPMTRGDSECAILRQPLTEWQKISGIGR